MILVDFGSQHIDKEDANILQEDILVTCSVLSAISNLSLSGGFEAGEFSLDLHFVVSSASESLPVEVAVDRVSSPLSASGLRRNICPLKKKPKPVLKKRVLSLALGKGVAIEDMSTYVKRALVGHVRGRNLSLGFLKKWVTSNWGSQVSTLLEVSKLMKGWFVFLMASKEDAN